MVIDSIKKIFYFLKRFRVPLQVTLKFVLKGLKIVAKISSIGIVKGLDLPLTIVIIQVGIGTIPVAISVACLLYVVFERKAEISPSSQIGFISMMFVATFLIFVSMIGFSWLLSKPIDLLILTVTFTPGWGLIWVIYGYGITSMGLIAWIVCAFIGPPPDGINEGNLRFGDLTTYHWS